MVMGKNHGHSAGVASGPESLLMGLRPVARGVGFIWWRLARTNTWPIKMSFTGNIWAYR